MLLLRARRQPGRQGELLLRVAPTTTKKDDDASTTSSTAPATARHTPVLPSLCPPIPSFGPLMMIDRWTAHRPHRLSVVPYLLMQPGCCTAGAGPRATAGPACCAPSSHAAAAATGQVICRLDHFWIRRARRTAGVRARAKALQWPAGNGKAIGKTKNSHGSQALSCKAVCSCG